MQIIKGKTQSLCNVCYNQIPAMVFERNRQVYIRKWCPQHGETEGLIEKDVRLYRRLAHIRSVGHPKFSLLVIPVTYIPQTEEYHEMTVEPVFDDDDIEPGDIVGTLEGTGILPKIETVDYEFIPAVLVDTQHPDTGYVTHP